VYAIEGKLAAGQENNERDPSVHGLHPERNHRQDAALPV